MAKMGFFAARGRQNKPIEIRDEIWHLSVHRGSAIAHHIWSSSVKECRYRSPQMSKFTQNCGFWRPEADTMNTFRWNLAWQCRPWVCSSTPNLAIIGKRGWLQESPKYPKLPKIMVFGHRKPTQWTHSDEIWRISVLLLLPSSPSFPPCPRPSKTAKIGFFRFLTFLLLCVR